MQSKTAWLADDGGGGGGGLSSWWPKQDTQRKTQAEKMHRVVRVCGRGGVCEAKREASFFFWFPHTLLLLQAQTTNCPEKRLI